MNFHNPNRTPIPTPTPKRVPVKPTGPQMLWNGMHWICQKTFDHYRDEQRADKITFSNAKDVEIHHKKGMLFVER